MGVISHCTGVRTKGRGVGHSLCRSALAVLLASALSPVTTHGAAVAPIGKYLANGVGYVALVQLTHQAAAYNDGKVLLAFEQPGITGVPLYERSRPGEKWNLIEHLTDQAHGNDSGWQLRWQPDLFVLSRASGSLPVGTVLLAANATRDDSQGRVEAEDLELYASRDGGHTWHYRSSIVRGHGQPGSEVNHGVWEPDVRVLGNGVMAAYYSSEQYKAEGYNQLIAEKISRDGGRKWSSAQFVVAIPGGVERPGMPVVTHLPDGEYVMSYEDIDGPNNGQVYLKFSSDGLHWGEAAVRGTPVETQSGEWPAACPVVEWLPVGGRDGVLVVLAQRAGGGGDSEGHTMYWNNDLGRGPWWEAPAPVQKLTGNIHAGWTQGLLLQSNGMLLHISSSSSPGSPGKARDNTILYGSAPAEFDRYEAEDAARRWAVQVGNLTASDGRTARVAAYPRGRLGFFVHLDSSGPKRLRVRWRGLAFKTHPVLSVDGHVVTTYARSNGQNGGRFTTFRATLTAGNHTVTLQAKPYAMDVDYLQIDSAQTNVAKPVRTVSASEPAL